MRHIELSRVLRQLLRQTLEAGVAAVHAGPERRGVALRRVDVAYALCRARRQNTLKEALKLCMARKDGDETNTFLN